MYKVQRFAEKSTFSRMGLEAMHRGISGNGNLVSLMKVELIMITEPSGSYRLNVQIKHKAKFRGFASTDNVRI